MRGFFYSCVFDKWVENYFADALHVDFMRFMMDEMLGGSVEEQSYFCLKEIKAI